MLKRRTLFGGMLAALAAPAIIRTPGLLMPVKPIPLPAMSWAGEITIAYDRYSGKAWARRAGDREWHSLPVSAGAYYPSDADLAPVTLLPVPVGYKAWG